MADGRTYNISELDIMREFSENIMNDRNPFTAERERRLRKRVNEASQARNTAAQEELLNRLQFNEDPSAAMDPATYIAMQDNEFRSLVPFGFEDQNDLLNNPYFGSGGDRAVRGAYIPLVDTIAFPGQGVSNATIDHEGRHSKFTGFNNLSEEVNNRNIDILTATAKGDFDTVDKAERWKEEYLRKGSEITQNQFEAMLEQINQAVEDNPAALQGYEPQLLEPEFMRGQNQIDFSSLEYKSLSPHDKVAALNNAHKFRIENGKYTRRTPIPAKSLFGKLKSGFKNLF